MLGEATDRLFTMYGDFFATLWSIVSYLFVIPWYFWFAFISVAILTGEVWIPPVARLCKALGALEPVFKKIFHPIPILSAILLFLMIIKFIYS